LELFKLLQIYLYTTKEKLYISNYFQKFVSKQQIAAPDKVLHGTQSQTPLPRHCAEFWIIIILGSSASVLGVCVSDTRGGAMTFAQGNVEQGMQWKLYETIADYGNIPFLSVTCPVAQLPDMQLLV